MKRLLDPRQDQTRLFLLALLVTLGAVWALSNVLVSREKQESASSQSSRPIGLKAWTLLKERLSPNPVRALRKPILSDSDLDGVDSLFLVSPKRALSSRELKLIEARVRRGLLVIIGFHDETSHQYFADLLHAAGVDAPLVDFPGFKPGKPVSVKVKEPQEAFGDLLHSGETYEFYSRLRFQDTSCALRPETCYMRTGSIGDGRVIAFVGIAPFTNGMMARADNRLLSLRLAKITGRTLLDEYHLYFNEKSTTDLLREPGFTLPFLGLLIGLFLYFFLGEDLALSAFHTKTRASSKVRSFHQFNRQLIRRVLETPEAWNEATQRQVDWLRRSFPSASTELNKITNERDPLELTRFHQNWLRSRGRK